MIWVAGEEEAWVVAEMMEVLKVLVVVEAEGVVLVTEVVVQEVDEVVVDKVWTEKLKEECKIGIGFLFLLGVWFEETTRS
ncbi:hypothetical protein ACHQM5_016516 [Ranunculus cassubicifolius]